MAIIDVFFKIVAIVSSFLIYDELF